jgi:hypothetical protein
MADCAEQFGSWFFRQIVHKHVRQMHAQPPKEHPWTLSEVVLQQQQLCVSPRAPADVQKASKQAIYSLLRGDFDRAAQQHHTAGE